MMTLVLFLLAIGVLGYAGYWFSQQYKQKKIGQMNREELVEAIIEKKISILEVPLALREEVNQDLQQIQNDLDQLQ